MLAFRVVAFGLFGLAFGSFLTVVIDRVPRKASIVAPPSACPSCGTLITARDNVPLVSFLLLRGRCRTCGTAIPPIYPILEATTGVLFASSAIAFHRPYVAAIVALFFAVMLGVSVIDAQVRIIPNRITYPSLIGFAVLVLVGAVAGQPLDVLRAAIGLGAFGVSLLIVALASGGMGLGDVKLAALIGLVLGSLGLVYVAVAAAAAFLIGGLLAVGALVVLHVDRKHAMPFGPSLAAGAVVAVFLAPRVAAWYSAALH